jgi:glycosyltransferase involved in cell wall biosynthesis
MSGNPKPFVVACIPAYDEEKSIGSVVVQASQYVDRVIVCDDGSKDLTSAIAEGLGAVVLRHERNLGKGVALKTAFLYAKCLEPDVVVMLDGDGQHNPADIPLLLRPIIQEEADIVVGSRFIKGAKMNAPFYRKLGLRIINFLSGKANEVGIIDTQSGFRSFSAKAMGVMLTSKVGGYGVETEQLVLAYQNKLKIIEVPVNVQYNGLANTSKKNPAFHGFEIIDTILTLIVEERPLLFLALPGVVLFSIGVVNGIYFLWYFNNTRLFNVPIALITMFSVFLGFVLILSSMTLYAIKRVGFSSNAK